MSNADGFDEDAALNMDPFEGDFGDGEQLISNAIVDAPTCNFCAGTIKAGTRCRCQIETTSDVECANGASDLTVEIHYFCAACCKAMAKEDDGEAVERRIEIGRRKRATCVVKGFV